MAIVTRSGGRSTLWFGRQRGRGAKISHEPAKAARTTTGGTANSPETGTTNDHGIGNIIRRRFPFVSLGFDLASEQVESRSITGRDAAAKRTGGQLWCEGPIELELLPGDILHWLRMFFNTAPNPRNTAITGLASASTSTFTVKAGEAVLQPPNNFAITQPSRVQIVLTTARTGSKLTVVGHRRIGRPDDEQRPVTEVIDVDTSGTNTGKQFTSKHFFSDITSMTLSGGSSERGDLPTTVTLITNAYHNKLAGFGANLFPGATVLMEKGGEPHWAQDVVGNTFELSLDDTLTATVGLIGGRYEEFQSIETGDADTFALDDDWKSDTYYPLGDFNFMPSFGGRLLFGDDEIDVISLSISINLNLESSRSYRASRYRNRVKKTATPREITIVPRVYVESGTEAGDVFKRWRDIYIANSTEPLTAEFYNWDDFGKQSRMVFSFAGCQLTEVPASPVEDSADMERDLTFLSLPTITSPSNELVFDLYGDQYLE